MKKKQKKIITAGVIIIVLVTIGLLFYFGVIQTSFSDVEGTQYQTCDISGNTLTYNGLYHYYGFVIGVTPNHYLSEDTFDTDWRHKNCVNLMDEIRNNVNKYDCVVQGNSYSWYGEIKFNAYDDNVNYILVPYCRLPQEYLLSVNDKIFTSSSEHKVIFYYNYTEPLPPEEENPPEENNSIINPPNNDGTIPPEDTTVPKLDVTGLIIIGVLIISVLLISITIYKVIKHRKK